MPGAAPKQLEGDKTGNTPNEGHKNDRGNLPPRAFLPDQRCPVKVELMLPLMGPQADKITRTNSPGDIKKHVSRWTLKA